MEKLTLRGFKFSERDDAKLNALVEEARRREGNGMFKLRINRTSLLQQLIHKDYERFSEELAKHVASVERAKKRATKKRDEKKTELIAE